jgi:hypothetical protein
LTEKEKKKTSFTTRVFEAQPIQRDQKRGKGQPDRADLKAKKKKKTHTHIKKHEKLKKQQL